MSNLFKIAQARKESGKWKKIKDHKRKKASGMLFNSCTL